MLLTLVLSNRQLLAQVHVVLSIEGKLHDFSQFKRLPNFRFSKIPFFLHHLCSLGGGEAGGAVATGGGGGAAARPGGCSLGGGEKRGGAWKGRTVGLAFPTRQPLIYIVD